MSLIRDLPFTMVAQPDTLLATCSALISSAASTDLGLQPIRQTTAAMLITTGDIGYLGSNTCQGSRVSSGGIVTSTFGEIIDRLRQPIGAHYQAAVVAATLNSTRGSTEADRKCALGVSLWAGDSSGGGDLAELSTGMRPRDRVFFTSVRTTDMLDWDVEESSSAINLQSNPGQYDLRNAGRYLQVRGRYGINQVTTESSGDEQCRAGAVITFMAGDLLPPALDTSSPFSTSTSTA